MGADTFHKGKYYITFKRNVDDNKKDVTITVLKVFENNSLKILLSDDEDPSFLCILSLTRSDYEDLKKQQGLLIDFDNFPAQLVRLLQQCAANNMFLILLQTNPLQYYFEIVEHNEFRRLVHLSLKTAPASDNDIKRHMSDTINELKKNLSTLKLSASKNESLCNEKCISMERKIHDLTITMSKMEEDKLRRETEFREALRREKEMLSQERMDFQNNIETTTKSQIAALQEIINRKDKNIEDFNMQSKQLQEKVITLEHQLSDKGQRLHMLEREVQKSHIEVATTMAKNATLEKDLIEKESFIQQLQRKMGDYEKTLIENSNTIKDLNSTMQLLRTEKISLEERLTISESLTIKNNEAVQNTSEQLLKANQIISKQNTDLIEMKDKLLCRTAIALEQEKVIERSSKEMEDLKMELKETILNMNKVKLELENYKEKLDSNEKSLKDKDETIKNNNMVIQWLHKKMEDNCNIGSSLGKEKQLAASTSTPYFRSNQNSSDEVSDDLINFYATSSLSAVGESPKTEVLSRNGKTGLDAKYLQPAIVDNRKKGTNKAKSTDLLHSKDKENKNTNLPKVDYREKKSTRSISHRTPVSAYFP